MKTLNYQARFADQVKDETKRQTIRRLRKNRFVVGDDLRHYTGQRTKKCIKLLDSVCTQVQQITIARDGVVTVAGEALNANQAFELAKADGFGRYGAMLSWIDKTHGLPFEGQIVNW